MPYWESDSDSEDFSELQSCKVLICGDGAIGKTCLIESLMLSDAIDWDAPEYVPTAAGNREAEWFFDASTGQEEEFPIELWDTAGQESLAALRMIAYPGSHIVLLGFDMTRWESLENITEMWMEEVEEGCEEDPPFAVILVGTKYDLWLELKEQGNDQECVSYEAARKVAIEIEANGFVCTSAKTMQGCVDEDGVEADKTCGGEGQFLREKIMELLWLAKEGGREEVPYFLESDLDRVEQELKSERV